jgi:hypothetical protein
MSVYIQNLYGIFKNVGIYLEELGLNISTRNLLFFDK